MQKKIVIPISVAVLILVISGYLLFKKTPAPKNKVTGTVSNVIDKPNKAEDGYYGFDVTNDHGKKYSVNATGYLDTPLLPGDRGEACVQVPKVADGDKVEFNLPEAQGQKDAFVICYQKYLTGYYFKVE